MSIELFNLEKGYTVFSKNNYVTKRHAHYPIEIVCCRTGSFKVTTENNSYTNLKNVIIPPNLPHSFSCLDATCDLLFLDPLSNMGRYIMQEYNLACLKDILPNVSELDQFNENGKFNISELVNRAELTVIKELDSRILSCVQKINSIFSDSKITLSQLSEISYLSVSRFSHLFKKQLGISVHQYILWKKISLAVLKSREEYSLTECAHYVGFSDSSHFNRAFYKMFGIKPFFVLKS